jgi:hypothetical protein
LVRLAEFDIPMPDEAQPVAETLRQPDEIGSPATVATAGGRFFGLVNGGALPVSIASTWLATAWNQNTALLDAAPATAELERIALGWLLDLLRLPAHAGGAFVTGTTMANFSALAAARHALLRRQGWDVEGAGFSAHHQSRSLSVRKRIPLCSRRSRSWGGRLDTRARLHEKLVPLRFELLGGFGRDSDTRFAAGGFGWYSKALFALSVDGCLKYGCPHSRGKP